MFFLFIFYYVKQLNISDHYLDSYLLAVIAQPEPMLHNVSFIESKTDAISICKVITVVGASLCLSLNP